MQRVLAGIAVDDQEVDVRRPLALRELQAKPAFRGGRLTRQAENAPAGQREHRESHGHQRHDIEDGGGGLGPCHAAQDAPSQEDTQGQEKRSQIAVASDLGAETELDRVVQVSVGEKQDGQQADQQAGPVPAAEQARQDDK